MKKYKFKTSDILEALLEHKVLNRKLYNNWSLHSWISALRNYHYIPIESVKTADGTCDYYMLPEEILRYKDPVTRKQQLMEMVNTVQETRRRKAIRKLEQVNVFLKVEKR